MTKIITCMSCGNKNKIGGSLKGRTCKECGVRLDTQDRSGGAPIPIRKGKEKVREVEVVKVVKEAGEFKQFGVLCLACKSVTPFGNKRCKNCRTKLKKNPRTTVYYNGVIEAIQCPKCGRYTDLKGVKCEHCKKKLKF